MLRLIAAPVVEWTLNGSSRRAGQPASGFATHSPPWRERTFVLTHRCGRRSRWRATCSLDDPWVVARDESGPRSEPWRSWYRFGTNCCVLWVQNLRDRGRWGRRERSGTLPEMPLKHHCLKTVRLSIRIKMLLIGLAKLPVPDHTCLFQGTFHQLIKVTHV